MKTKYRDLLYGVYNTTHIRNDGETLLNVRSGYLKNFIRKFFPRDKNLHILEVGCGYGALIYYARLLGYRNITGIDVSIEQVTLAENLGIHGVSLGDLHNIVSASTEEAFGAIIAFDVMEHMDRNELIQFLEGVKRILKKNGQLILHIPNGASPFFGRVRYGDLTHEICFTQYSISQLLYATGFNDVKCFEESPAVVSVTSAIRWLFWKIYRKFMSFILMAESGVSDEIFSQNIVVIAQ